jgi:DNA-directed RNA polymerase
MSTTRPIRAPDSFNRTLDKFIKDEMQAHKRRGPAFTKQMRRVVDKYAEGLAILIAHERATRRPDRDPEIWATIGHEPDLGIALTMLVAGIHAGIRGYRPPKRKPKYKPTAYKWYAHVGEELGFDRGEPALIAGMWSAKFLTRLPMFDLTDDGMIVVRLDVPEVCALVNDAVNRIVTRRPQLLPLEVPPAWAAAGDPVDVDAKPSISVVEIGAPDLVTHHPMVSAQFDEDIALGRGRNVIDALNWMQQTPYRINRSMLDLLKREAPVPEEPPAQPQTWHKDNSKQKLAEKNYRAQLKWWSRSFNKWQNFHWMIAEAEILSDADRYPRDEFYNLIKLDFRGRLVVLQSFAYQGDDATRSLFEFKNGATIGIEGIRWLKAHVAARAGGWKYSDHPKPDRLNFDGRIAWTERHVKQLCRIGDRILAGKPLDPNVLPEKGERYQFARACVELTQAMRIGPAFVTHLPLVFDASCSGLQHIAMMLQSEDGRYANFYSGDTPCDLYQAVADWITKEKPALWCGIEERHYRNIVKRPTMTEFYGSTLHGKAGQIFEELIYLIPKHERTAEKYKAVGKQAIALAGAVVQAIANIVPAIVVYRTYVECLCAKYVAANKSMKWPAPWLTLLNPYYGLDLVEVSHGRGRSRTRVKHCRGNTDQVRPDAVQKIAANLTHSADAALLHAVALAARNAGIEIIPIHDCWGCLAPHAARLNIIIREQMKWLHTEHDWLGLAYRTALAELPGVDIDAPPSRGDYDPDNFLKSFFAIS